MKDTKWLHDVKWRFLIQIGDNEYSISDTIPRCKNLDTASNHIRPEVHQFVNELIESAQKRTLDTPQPTPQLPRKTFDAKWSLEVKGDSRPSISKLRGRKTVLDSLIRIQKDIRGKI